MSLWLVNRLILRRLVTDWPRSLLLLSTLAISAVVFVAILDAGDKSSTSFSQSLKSAQGESPAIIKSEQHSLAAHEMKNLYPLVQRDFRASALIETSGVVSGQLGTRTRIKLVALDLIPLLGLQQPQLDPNEGIQLFVSPSTLSAVEKDLGPLIELTLNGQTRKVTVKQSENLNDQAFVADLHLMKRAFRLPGSVSRIILFPKQHETSAFAALEYYLRNNYPNLRLLTPKVILAENKNVLAAFSANVKIMCAMCSFLCAFLVFCSFSASIRSLRPEISTLKLLGISQLTIFMGLLLESILFGISGGTIGLLLGGKLSLLIERMFIETAAELYFPAGGMLFTANHSLTSKLFTIIACVLSTLAGGIYPALSAAGIRPTLITKSAPDIQIYNWRRISSLCGGLFILTLGGCSAAWLFNNYFLAQLACFSLVACMLVSAFPVSYVLVLRSKRLIARLFGVSGMFAVSNLQSSIRQTGFSVATTATGLALLIALGVMISSFRASLAEWIDFTVTGDLFIRTDETYQNNLTPSLIEALNKNLSPIARLSRFMVRESEVSIPAARVRLELAAAELEVQDRQRYRILAGDFNFSGLSAGSHALISESASKRFNLIPGNKLQIRGHDFEIAGIYQDFSSERGYLLISYHVYSQLFSESIVKSLSLYARRDADISKIAAMVSRLTANEPVRVYTSQELKSRILGIFDRTFKITEVMRIVIVIICFLGIATFLLQLLWERRREFDTLWMLGMSRTQIVFSSLIEISVLTTIATLVGVLTGLCLALILVYLINPLSFGWTLELRLHWQDFAWPSLIFIAYHLIAVFTLLLPHRHALMVADE